MGHIPDDFDDQHIRQRGESSPIAIRLVALGVLLFWVTIVMAVKGCA